MHRFRQYPVVINYNLHAQFRSRGNEDALHAGGKYAEESQVSVKTNTASDARLENGIYKKEIADYESTVFKFLQKIDANPVGRMVLGLINKQATVWIIPKSDADLKQCFCAQTWPLNYDLQMDGSAARGSGSGDTVIQFRPELGDDTLFHELVHAYRYSYKKFQPMQMNIHSGQSSGFESTEEFLAHQMENIYRSQSNRPLELDYMWASTSAKKEIYDFLLDNVEILQTLKYFLRHEYLAMLAANTFITEYNPFRDYKDLESKFLKDSSLSGIPELGMMLTN